MTRTLVLLRHGKSDWSADYGADRERPLAPRGRKAASRVGRFLHSADCVPQHIVTSPAVRAARTVELAAEAGNWYASGLGEIEVDQALYGATPEQVLAVLRRQDDQHERILLAGHEPTWSRLASRLIGGGRLRVPTAALVVIDFEVAGWRDVTFGGGELRLLLPPRMLS